MRKRWAGLAMRRVTIFLNTTRNGSRSRTPLLVSNDRAAMSLAGAQDKTGLRFDNKTRLLRDSVGQSPTTHILKPDTRQARYQPSAINEYACTKLALMPAWQKVRALIACEPGVTEAEIVLLKRMTQLFEQHRDNALSMSQR